jgi:SpoVK/Ycf46/Vps4 family AAA+-type ATPase
MAKRSRRRFIFSKASLQPYSDICGLWGLRILLDLGGWKGLAGYPGSLTFDGDMLQAIGLGEHEDEDMSPAAFLRMLRDRQAELEADADHYYKPLAAGMRRLGEAFHIGPAEQLIQAFAAIIADDKFLDNVADSLGQLNSAGVVQVLSVVLDLPGNEVNKALAADSHLSRSGLLRLNRRSSEAGGRKLEPLAGIGDLMFDHSHRVEDFLVEHFSTAAAATLTVSDYPHLQDWIDDLCRYLAQARATNLVGVNVLLYGPPGTGKTELAKAVAAALGFVLYEVSCIDEDGDAIGGRLRLRAYQLAQYCLARDERALVLFDEVEDVFSDHDNPFERLLQTTRDKSKGYTNRLLESNTIPSFWLTNDAHSIDPAFKRRFDLVLEMPIPPQRVRRRIAAHHLGRLPVSEAWLDGLSRHQGISPAVLGCTARVVGAIIGAGDDANADADAEDGRGGQQERVEQRLERLIGGQLRVQGLPDRLDLRPRTLTAYRPDLLNTDRPIAPIVAGIVRGRRARLCLYGDPGTGKSAFADHIAEQIGCPLLRKRASDLLRPYVGETEMLIGQMFREAEDDGAVLLLDEADSFLRDRRQARQGWEVTQVNELLTRMETYEGVFICATNLVDDLDPAAARRFDFKLRFDALRLDQRWTLFTQVLREQGFKGARKVDWLPRLAGLDGLTPGDFAAVIRQGRIQREPLRAGELFERLRGECVFRDRTQSRGIGFGAVI